MRSKSITYKTFILNEPIVLDDGRSFDQTAIIEKWNGTYQLYRRKLAAPSIEYIYSKIKNEEDINLDECYIKDFSLSAYRELNDIEENEIIKLNSFSASNSFFESIYGSDFSYSHFSKKQGNFSYAIFNQGNVNFGHTICDSTLNFNRAEFYLEELSFRFAQFDKGDLRFSFCIFDCKDVLFVNTIFGRGNVSFRQADFLESNCNFQYAQFDMGDVSFDKANFRGDTIDFRKVEFGTGKAEFRRVNFGNGNVNFNESEFKEGKVNFRNAIFGKGECTFENIDFGPNEVQFDHIYLRNGLLSFRNSSFEKLSMTDAKLYGHVDLRINKGNYLDLSYSILKDVLDLQAGKHKVELDTLKIHGIKNLGKIFIFWIENKVEQLINSQADSDHWSKAEQFNLLKESFNSNGKYSSEDKAYVAFKRHEMLALLKHAEEKSIASRFKARLVYGFQWLIFDRAGLFATAPLRVFTSMLVVLSAFAILYIILPFVSNSDIVSSVGDPDSLNVVQKSFYHSAITFFTIGYGDFYPSGHIRWLSAVEGWAGVFLMSYFTVAFVRKILR